MDKQNFFGRMVGWLFGVVYGMSVVTFTGCGQNEVDYRVEEATESTVAAESDGKREVSQFAGEVWQDTWTIDAAEHTLEVSVNAEVILPEVEQMSVVEVRIQQMDAEMREKVARALFVDGDVYYNDVEHLPRKVLEKRYTERMEHYESVDEMFQAGMEPELEQLEELMEQAGDTYILADTFESMEYRGERENIEFELYFGIDDPEEMATFSQHMSCHNVDDVCPKNMSGYHYLMHPYMTTEKHRLSAKNECAFSEAEAEELAGNMLRELGFEYPILESVHPLIWGDETMSTDTYRTWPANGYVFNYLYGVEGCPLVEKSTFYRLDYKRYEEVSSYDTDAKAMVYVTDSGIIGVYVFNPVETLKISDGVELLPLQTIQSIMRAQIEKEAEQYITSGEAMQDDGKSQLNFNCMELIYFRVRDKEHEGFYSYVPAWRLSEQYGIESVDGMVVNGRTILNHVIVNAIDGTVIDYYNET